MVTNAMHLLCKRRWPMWSGKLLKGALNLFDVTSVLHIFFLVADLTAEMDEPPMTQSVIGGLVGGF